MGERGGEEEEKEEEVERISLTSWPRLLFGDDLYLLKFMTELCSCALFFCLPHCSYWFKHGQKRWAISSTHAVAAQQL